MPILAILGRQTELSIAELESVFGAANISPVNQNICGLLNIDSVAAFDQLGGVQKAATTIAELKSSDWRQIIREVAKHIDGLTSSIEGKINLGLSVYGLPLTIGALNAGGLELKKQLKKNGRSVRVVPNKTLDLNAAQVLYNKLIGPSGVELIISKNKGGVLLAKTVWVQNIEAYAARDQARPKRDAKVGMLPPKLAQTILNLSGFDESKTVLDPFCGTGVVLQEALMMGGRAIGSDIEARMVDYTKSNLERLKQGNFSLQVGDATTCKWKEDFDCVACETYLGRPLSSLPDRQTLEKIVQDVNTIHKKFLTNLSRQTPAGLRLCLAVPAWKIPKGFLHLPILDRLTDLGYNRVSFVHTPTTKLIYHRENQLVARELVVLERI